MNRSFFKQSHFRTLFIDLPERRVKECNAEYNVNNEKLQNKQKFALKAAKILKQK